MTIFVRMLAFFTLLPVVALASGTPSENTEKVVVNHGKLRSLEWRRLIKDILATSDTPEQFTMDGGGACLGASTNLGKHLSKNHNVELSLVIRKSPVLFGSYHAFLVDNISDLQSEIIIDMTIGQFLMIEPSYFAGTHEELYKLFWANRERIAVGNWEQKKYSQIVDHVDQIYGLRQYSPNRIEANEVKWNWWNLRDHLNY